VQQQLPTNVEMFGVVTISASTACNLTVSPGTQLQTCAGTPLSITASGQGITSYSWSPATGLSSATGAQVTFNGSASTTYTVTGTSASGTCTSVVSVQVIPAGSATISGVPAQVCQNSGSYALSANPSGGTFSGTGVSGASFNADGLNPGTYTITYTQPNGPCGAITATQTVDVITTPSPNFTYSPQNPTPGQLITFTNTSTGAGNSYTWFVDGAQFDTSVNPTLTIATAGPHVIRLVATNPAGCTGEIEKTIIVSFITTSCPDPAPTEPGLYSNPLPDGTINTPYAEQSLTMVFPKQQTIDFQGQSVTFEYIRFKVLGHVTAANNSLPTGLAFDTTTCNLAACAYDSAALVQSNYRGCIKLAAGTPTQSGQFEPTVNLKFVAKFFVPATVQLLLGLPSTGPFYTDNLPAALSQFAGQIPTTTSISTSLTIIGNFTCDLTVTPSAPSTCAAGTVSISASQTGATSYTWAPATGLNTTTGATVVFSGSAGNRTYTVTASDASGNSCSTTVAVTVTNTATPTIAGLQGSYCQGFSNAIQLLGSPSGGTFKLGTTALTGSTLSIAALTPGTYTVTYEVTGTCAGTGTASFTVNALPSASISGGPTATVEVGQSVSLSSSASTGAASFEWWVNGVQKAQTAGYTFSEGTEGTYEVALVAKSQAGCTDTTSISIEVVKNSSRFDQSLASRVVIYPNPAKGGTFTLESPVASGSVTILNSVGQVLHTIELNETKQVIRFTAPAAGVYFVRLNTATGIAVKQLVVVE
jgi:PKD repeat protein